MTRNRILAALTLPAIALGMAGCQTVYENTADNFATATLQNRAGADVGEARFYTLAGEVTVSGAFAGLTPGTPAVHLHTTGDCSATDFTSAGGHLNPGNNQHGTMNPQGAHLGDLPNVTIDANGNGTVSSVLRGTQANVASAMFDADGTAIVVHEGADDYRTDPAGDAGSRVACGLVSRV